MAIYCFFEKINMMFACTCIFDKCPSGLFDNLRLNKKLKINCAKIGDSLPCMSAQSRLGEVCFMY